jgi:hypothetical protein
MNVIKSIASGFGADFIIVVDLEMADPGAGAQGVVSTAIKCFLRQIASLGRKSSRCMTCALVHCTILPRLRSRQVALACRVCLSQSIPMNLSYSIAYGDRYCVKRRAVRRQMRAARSRPGPARK